MTIEVLLILALATFRVGRFMIIERGPFAIMENIRKRFDDYEISQCIHCLSIWIAPIMFVLWSVGFHIPLEILAIAGAVSLARDFMP